MASLTPKAGDAKSIGMASQLLSCLAYSLCSITMVLSNKALAAVFHVDIPVLLVVMQCSFAVLLVEASRIMGIVSYQPFQSSVALRWLPVNLCFVVMLMTSFRSFKFLNVPIITVFKNLTNILIVAGDWYWHGQRITLGIIAAFGVMVVGAVFAAKNDVLFSFEGYCWMLGNCLSTASYVLYMKTATKSVDISKFGMVFYNNLLSVPLLLPLAFGLGEVDTALANLDIITSLNFLFVNIVAGSMGFFLNLASLWCVSATSATTYALVGSVNKIPVALLGAFLFDAAISSQGAIYIGVSMCGGFIYSYVKLTESPRK
uniref:Sugar phosphate transporter domain-containing protein n=1 Tax=Rhizochromulina marina TaxID=1034831 RepID=A0A7S2SW66_9STRA